MYISTICSLDGEYIRYLFKMNCQKKGKETKRTKTRKKEDVVQYLIYFSDTAKGTDDMKLYHLK